MPRISVIVPTRNRADLLPELLRALDVQTHPNYEVIVVDDASSDETPDLLAAWVGDGHVALRLNSPSGSYVARNAGWRWSRGEIVAFTDDDCRPSRDWLSSLDRALREPGSIGVQGVTLAEPGEITPFTHQIQQRRPGAPYRTCNIAYRRDLLERLGGFEPLRWYADNILGLRARREGSIAFAADAVVRHPPRPRDWRDRGAWLARFDADVAHRRWLRALGAERVGPGDRGLPIVLWVLRPLVKQSLAHMRYFTRHPLRYCRAVRPMLREKRELLAALRIRRYRNSNQPAQLLPSLGPDPLVSIVVVTRDRPDSLRRTLDALSQQTYRRCEVLVVDHSLHETARQVAVAAGVGRIAVPGTLAGARQRGVDATAGEIVVFTDDDCLPEPHWVDSLVAAFRSRPDAWGIQGRTLAERGDIGNHAVAVSGPDRLYRTCNIAYRRAALDAVGGFDERFGGWFEDTALGAQVSQRGEICFAPAATVVHRAMPRRPLDRRAWRRVLADERLLATDYADFYRRTRGPGFVPVVLARWMIGSPLKALWRDLPRGLEDPAAYATLFLSLVRERAVLAGALRDVLAGGSSSQRLSLTSDVERVAQTVAEK